MYIKEAEKVLAFLRILFFRGHIWEFHDQGDYFELGPAGSCYSFSAVPVCTIMFVSSKDKVLFVELELYVQSRSMHQAWQLSSEHQDP